MYKHNIIGVTIIISTYVGMHDLGDHIWGVAPLRKSVAIALPASYTSEIKALHGHNELYNF